MEWPFRFYGAQPAEWYGGGRLDYELQFARAPGPGERAAIAAAIVPVEAGFQAVRLDGHDRWSWAGDWAWLIVRTRAMELDWDTFFAEIATLFRAIHGSWPLTQVVCRSVDPGPAVPDDAWTAWSLARQADIGPRPHWRDDGGRAARDRYAPRGAERPAEVIHDPAFEAARLPRR
ncbi:MAG TPA: hypothetical protein VM734_24075 [Kofleriaceae bacterium]|jgi:hypothetical protein|nr:hypothetical protein [Kofleriaceae bacterium]